MAFEQIPQQISSAAGSLYSGGTAALGTTATNLLLFSFGIAIYAIIIGTFYTKVSKRILYSVDLESRLSGLSGFTDRLFRLFALLVRYTLIFPLITFAWILLLAVMLSLLSQTIALETIFLTSLAVVASIRITAYYREEIAVDLAKMLPLAMLAVFIIDQTSVTRELLEARISDLLTALPSFLHLFVLVIALEWLLRLLLGIKHAFLPPQEEEEK